MSKLLLRKLIAEIIKIPATYVTKEQIRKELQDMIVNEVRSGKIVDDETLRDVFDTVHMALKTLEMIPYSVFKRLAEKT